MTSYRNKNYGVVQLPRCYCYRIKRDRAEVIGFAVNIFIDAANAIQMDEIVVPSISIADGIINKMFVKYAGGK